MAVEDTVNLKRDVQESKSDIIELWEDSDEIWEEMGAMLASFSSINELKQRIALIETELKYMNRDHRDMLDPRG